MEAPLEVGHGQVFNFNRNDLMLQGDGDDSSQDEDGDAEDGARPEPVDGELVRNQPLLFSGPLTGRRTNNQNDAANDSEEDPEVAEESSFSHPHK